AKRRAGDADVPRGGQAGRDQSLGAGGQVGLLATAPAVFLDALAVGQPEAGAAAIVRVQNVESGGDQVLDLGVEPVFGARAGPAVDVDDRSPRVGPRSVEPALDLQPVDRPPVVIL